MSFLRERQSRSRSVKDSVRRGSDRRSWRHVGRHGSFVIIHQKRKQEDHETSQEETLPVTRGRRKPNSRQKDAPSKPVILKNERCVADPSYPSDWKRRRLSESHSEREQSIVEKCSVRSKSGTRAALPDKVMPHHQPVELDSRNNSLTPDGGFQSRLSCQSSETVDEGVRDSSPAPSVVRCKAKVHNDEQIVDGAVSTSSVSAHAESPEVNRTFFGEPMTASRDWLAFFSESRWPSNCEEFWKWPPIVRCFQDISDEELAFLRMPEFQSNSICFELLRNSVQNYRLRWLVEDVRTLAGEDRLLENYSRALGSNEGTTNGSNPGENQELKHNHRRGIACPACTAKTSARRASLLELSEIDALHKQCDNASSAEGSRRRALTNAWCFWSERFYLSKMQFFSTETVHRAHLLDSQPFLGTREGQEDITAISDDTYREKRDVPDWRTSHASSDLSSICDICSSWERSCDNPLLTCRECGVSVHSQCYGAEVAGGSFLDVSDSWTCNACQQSKGTTACLRSAEKDHEIICVLCGTTGGVLKPTNDGRWAHLVCAIWTPDIYVESEKSMEPIGGLKGISKGRHRRVCCICRTLSGEGGIVSCHWHNCSATLHPRCGQKAGCIVALCHADELRDVCSSSNLANALSPALHETMNHIVPLRLCKDHSQEFKTRTQFLQSNVLQNSSRLVVLSQSNLGAHEARPSVSEKTTNGIALATRNRPHDAYQTTNSRACVNRIQKVELLEHRVVSMADLEDWSRSNRLRDYLLSIQTRVKERVTQLRDAQSKNHHVHCHGTTCSACEYRANANGLERSWKQLGKWLYGESNPDENATPRLADASIKEQVVGLLNQLEDTLVSTDLGLDHDNLLLVSHPSHTASDQAQVPFGESVLPSNAYLEPPSRVGHIKEWTTDAKWLIQAMNSGETQILPSVDLDTNRVAVTNDQNRTSKKTKSTSVQKLQSTTPHLIPFRMVLDHSGLAIEGVYSWLPEQTDASATSNPRKARCSVSGRDSASTISSTRVALANDASSLSLVSYRLVDLMDLGPNGSIISSLSPFGVPGNTQNDGNDDNDNKEKDHQIHLDLRIRDCDMHLDHDHYEDNDDGDHGHDDQRYVRPTCGPRKPWNELQRVLAHRLDELVCLSHKNHQYRSVLLDRAQADRQHRSQLERSLLEMNACVARLGEMSRMRSRGSSTRGTTVPRTNPSPTNQAHSSAIASPSALSCVVPGSESLVTSLSWSVPLRHGGLARLESCVPMSIAEVEAEAAMHDTRSGLRLSESNDPVVRVVYDGKTDFHDKEATINTVYLEDSRLVPAYNASCNVCGNGDCDQIGNDIILCDRCGVAVHQKCYGVDTIPSGDWMCDACMALALDETPLTRTRSRTRCR